MKLRHFPDTRKLAPTAGRSRRSFSRLRAKKSQFSREIRLFRPLLHSLVGVVQRWSLAGFCFAILRITWFAGSTAAPRTRSWKPFPVGRVALGGYPPRAPTDPYVDTFDHTVPQVTPLLRRRPNAVANPSFAIRWRYGHTAREFKASQSVSRQRRGYSMPRFPSPGSVRVKFPGFIGIIEALRLPAVLPAALRFLRLAVPRGTQISLPPSLRAATLGLGLVTRYPPPGTLPWKQQELPSSWGTPIPVCTCSPTPAGRRVPDHCGTLAWPPLWERRRRQRCDNFGAQ